MPNIGSYLIRAGSKVMLSRFINSEAIYKDATATKDVVFSEKDFLFLEKLHGHEYYLFSLVPQWGKQEWTRVFVEPRYVEIVDVMP